MKGKLIVRGVPASPGVVVGRVRVVNGDETKMTEIQPGDIMVGNKFTPDHDIYMKKAAAFVTNTGGRSAHAAIVAREWGVPAVTGTEGDGYKATEELKDGQIVVVDGQEGTVHEYIGDEPPPIAVQKQQVKAVNTVLMKKMQEAAAARGITLNPDFLAKMGKR